MHAAAALWMNACIMLPFLLPNCEKVFRHWQFDIHVNTLGLARVACGCALGKGACLARMGAPKRPLLMDLDGSIKKSAAQKGRCSPPQVLASEKCSSQKIAASEKVNKLEINNPIRIICLSDLPQTFIPRRPLLGP